MLAVKTSRLSKVFGDVVAVDGLSLEVKQGEVFGLLGPNGAGKSTTIKMLTGLLSPTSGTIEVLGRHPTDQELLTSVGYVPQDLVFYGHLSAKENLELFANCMEVENAKERVTELLRLFELYEAKDRRAAVLSGGQKRRLNVAIAFLLTPQLLILDEPSAGMDPQSRNMLWEILEGMREESNITVILTTHLIETADRLCNRVAIVDHGKVIAIGTPSELKGKGKDGEILEIVLNNSPPDLMGKLNDYDVEITEHMIRFRNLDTFSELPKIVEKLNGLIPKESIRSFNIRQKTLEDVFIAHTGRSLRE